MHATEDWTEPKKENTTRNNFWLGFFIGFIAHLFALILAIFVKEKQIKRGMIIGAVISLVNSILFGIFLAFLFINSYRGPHPHTSIAISHLLHLRLFI